jgi:hypothetical protein
MTETRTYNGLSGGSGSFDGYAGLIVGTSYTGEEHTVVLPLTKEGAEPTSAKYWLIRLPNGRTATVTAEQWGKWFVK